MRTVRHFYSDGTLIVDEESIKTGDLPEAVMRSIQGAYSRSTIKSAGKLTLLDGIRFEVIVKSGKKTFEMEYDANGNTVNTEEMNGKIEND